MNEKPLNAKPLTEARRNPENNPKADILGTLFKLSKEPGNLVHFSPIQQVSINPKEDNPNNYYTPLGIYVYPLEHYSKKLGQAVIERSVNRKKNLNLPTSHYMTKIFSFAVDRRFIFILRARPGTKWLQVGDLGGKNMSQNEYNRRLKAIESDYLASGTPQEFHAVLSKVTKDYGTISPGAVLFNLIVQLYSFEPLKMNKILIGLGYDGVYDSGNEVIFKSADRSKTEPAQAVFLQKSFDIKDVLINHQYPIG